ncbi:MAG: UDP-glucose/GDP-mannose dehydrogenase family protein, partial [Candidatus Microthrix sp.]|nr:UDP-glucose/GDP-mannose dehydrogenase family protein [Candidatus Microthrix sp.]
AEGVDAGRLRFTTDGVAAVVDRQFIFLCVPTPQGADGAADLSYIQEAARTLGPHLASDSVVVNKSTVPVGSARVVAAELRRDDVSVVSNPEFLREGSAVADFLNPDRVVIGSDDRAAAMATAELYSSLNAPIMITDPASAETIKYASNAFLATKLSFINAVAAVCEAVGADVADVVTGMGYDTRIGPEFLRPGPGWGGSCFPKDTQAMVRIAADAGYDFGLLKGVVEVNDQQFDRVVDKIRRGAGGTLEGATVAIWGLTFKARTDDLRDSPAIEVASRLLAAGASVTAYDPTVEPGDESKAVPDGVRVVGDPLQASTDAAVLAVMTEWDQFRWVDLHRVAKVMTGDAVIDGRNLLNPTEVRAAGLSYDGIGRS